MILTHFRKLGFFSDAPGNMELGGLRIEISFSHADSKGCMDSCGRRGARGGLGSYAPERGGSKEIRRTDQVIGKPLNWIILGNCAWAEKRNRSHTMSSGSSGKSVMVPDPSRSMFCLIRRIVTSWSILNT